MKVRNNPQGSRVLANELVGGLLLDWLGVKHPRPHVVGIPPEVIQDSPGAKFDSGAPPESGDAFGSPLWQSDPGGTVDPKLISNKGDVAGTLVYDTWVRNHDSRQYRVRSSKDEPGKYEYIPIDQGYSFGSPNWTPPSLDADRTIAVPDCPVLITGDEVQPMIDRLCKFQEADANEIIGHVPDQWLAQEERQALKRYLIDRARLAANALQAKYPKTGV